MAQSLRPEEKKLSPTRVTRVLELEDQSIR